MRDINDINAEVVLESQHGMPEVWKRPWSLFLSVGATDKHTEILGTVEVYFSFDFALNSFGLVLFIIIELPAFEDLGRSVCIDVI